MWYCKLDNKVLSLMTDIETVRGRKGMANGAAPSTLEMPLHIPVKHWQSLSQHLFFVDLLGCG